MHLPAPLRARVLTALAAIAFSGPLWAATPAATPSTAGAAPSQAPPAPGSADTAKPKKKKQSTKVTYDKGSAETTAERDRRLKRECKGRPNAGACLGYAS